MATRSHTTDPFLRQPVDADDDEQDEDFVASEVEDDEDGEDNDEPQHHRQQRDGDSDRGNASDSSDDNDEDTGSEGENATDSEATATTANGNGAGQRRRLPPIDKEGLLQVLAGEDLPAFNEPILSDSEISRMFSEEDEDVLGALDTSDEDDEDGAEEEHSSGSHKDDVAVAEVATELGENGGMQRATTTAAAVGHSSAPHACDDSLPRVGSPAGMIMMMQSSVLDPLDAENKAAGHLRGEGHDDDTPIAQRTRAHVSLLDVPIEELEAMLSVATEEEPLLVWDVDDAAEYERFLAALQSDVLGGGGGVGGGGTAAEFRENGATIGGDNIDINGAEQGYVSDWERRPCGNSSYPNFYEGNGTLPRAHTSNTFEFDDDSDEDFELELERYGAVRRTSTAGGNARSTAFKSKKRKRARPPRRSARLLARDGAGPMYCARWKERQRWRLNHLASGGVIGGIDVGNDGAIPATAAAAAAATGLGTGLGVRGGEEEDSRLEALAWAAATMGAPQADGSAGTTASRAAGSSRVPLPSQSVAAALEEAKRVVWCQPLPKAMRKHEKRQISATEDAPIARADVKPEQYSVLYHAIHEHVQLLAQTLAMATAMGEATVVETTRGLLKEFNDFVTAQTALRMSQGNIPPYLNEFLGVETSGQRHRLSGGWLPRDPGPIFTVADVAIARQAPVMLQLMPRAEAVRAGMAGQSGVANQPLGAANATNASLGTSAGTTRKKKRRANGGAVLLPPHPVWNALPDDVAHALVFIRDYFNPGAEPLSPEFRATSQLTFTPGEDEILAWGIRKYCYDWARIKTEFLPCKSETMLFNRKKNRTAGRCGDNVVKQAVTLITGPLTAAEIALLDKATQYYSKKQPKRWEIIVKEHLPYRNPSVLSMLWSEHLKSPQRHVQPALMASQDTQCDVATRGNDNQREHHQHGKHLPAAGSRGMSFVAALQAQQPLECGHGGFSMPSFGELPFAVNTDATNEAGAEGHPSVAHRNMPSLFHTGMFPTGFTLGNMPSAEAAATGAPGNTAAHSNSMLMQTSAGQAVPWGGMHHAGNKPEQVAQILNSEGNVRLQGAALEQIGGIEEGAQQGQAGQRDHHAEERREELETNQGLVLSQNNRDGEHLNADAGKAILKAALASGGRLNADVADALAGRYGLLQNEVLAQSAILVEKFLKARDSRR